MALRKVTDQAIEYDFFKKRHLVYYIIFAYRGQEDYAAKRDQWCQCSVCFCTVSKISVMVQRNIVKSMDSGPPGFKSLLHHLVTRSVTLRKLPHLSLAQFHHL